MKAPKACCPLSGIRGQVSRSCKAAVMGPMDVKTGQGYYTPGPECPFVLLAAKDAKLKAIAEAKIDYTNPEEYVRAIRNILYGGVKLIDAIRG